MQIENRKKSHHWRIWLIICALLFVLYPYIRYSLLDPIFSRWTAWEGTIERVYTREHQSRWGSHTTYHWRVRCTDNKVRNVTVNLLLSLAHPGTRVRKVRGERWPQIIDRRNGYNLLEEQMGQRFPRQLRPLVPQPE